MKSESAHKTVVLWNAIVFPPLIYCLMFDDRRTKNFVLQFLQNEFRDCRAEETFRDNCLNLLIGILYNYDVI